MKITNKQLKQIVKEELSYVLHEQEEDTTQKLARYIRNGDKEALFHGLQLLEAAELEPWSRADLYQAIKQHADSIKEKMKILSSEIYELHQAMMGRGMTQYQPYVVEKKYKQLTEEWDQLNIEMKQIEPVLSKFKTNSMVYVDDPTME